MILRAFTPFVIGLAASAAVALEFDLPDAAQLVIEQTEPFDSLSLPVGPWTGGQIELYAAEGDVTRQVWTLRNSALTTLQIMAPLRDALTEAGYQILFDCKDDSCGGFDFRYALPLLPEPDMHVDLGDYRYLAAAPEVQDGADFISLTVSRGADTGYLHITRIGDPVVVHSPPAKDAPNDAPEPFATGVGPGFPLTALLDNGNRAALEDLRFATGSAELEDDTFPSLIELAAWLRNSPERQIILVGHSDAEGALNRNIDLSRRRAESVARRLATAHGVPTAQIRAEGVGFLVPRATNATPEGRATNRRVEVVPIAQ